MDVLILLIGGNPLPNYVTASYLLKTDRADIEELPVPQRIIFVCSGDTEKFVKTIKMKLISESARANDFFITVNLEDNQRKSVHIREKIRKEITNIPNIRSINLNYTGGTKPMAVHAYIDQLKRDLSQFQAAQHCEIIGISEIKKQMEPAIRPGNRSFRSIQEQLLPSLRDKLRKIIEGI